MMIYYQMIIIKICNKILLIPFLIKDRNEYIRITRENKIKIINIEKIKFMKTDRM